MGTVRNEVEVRKSCSKQALLFLLFHSRAFVVIRRIRVLASVVAVPWSQVPSPESLCRSWCLVPGAWSLFPGLSPIPFSKSVGAQYPRPPYSPRAFTYARANAFPKPHPGRQASPAAGDKNLRKSPFPRPERSHPRAQMVSHGAKLKRPFA